MKKTYFTAKRPHLLPLNAVKAVNFCKICVEFSGEKFFFTAFTGFRTKNKLEYRVFLLVAVNNFFSPHSTGCVEKFSFTAYAVKKIFSPLKNYFHRIHRIERKSYTFSQINRKSYIFKRFLAVTPRPGFCSGPF